MTSPTRYELGRAVECLRTMIERFEDQTFVRSTSQDGRQFTEFAASAFRTVAVLNEAKRIIADYDGVPQNSLVED